MDSACLIVDSSRGGAGVAEAGGGSTSLEVKDHDQSRRRATGEIKVVYRDERLSCVNL